MKVGFAAFVLFAFYCQSCSSFPYGSFEELFQNATDLSENFGKEFVLGFDLLSKEGKEFAELVKNKTEAFLKEAEELRQEYDRKLKEFFADNVNEFYEFLTKLIQILDEKLSQTHLDFIQEVRNALAVLNKEIALFQEKTNNIKRKITKNIQDVEISIQRDWNHFAAEQIDKVADATDDDEESIAEVETLINELINRYSNYMKSCASEYEDAFESYSSEVNDMIFRNEEVAKKLKKEIEECLNLNKEQKDVQECLALIKRELFELENLPNQFDEVGDEIKDLISSGFEGRACTQQTLLDFKRETFNIHKKVEKIIESFAN